MCVWGPLASTRKIAHISLVRAHILSACESVSCMCQLGVHVCEGVWAQDVLSSWTCYPCMCECVFSWYAGVVVQSMTWVIQKMPTLSIESYIEFLVVCLCVLWRWDVQGWKYTCDMQLHLCTTVNANRRAKSTVGLGMRLLQTLILSTTLCIYSSPNYMWYCFQLCWLMWAT